MFLPHSATWCICLFSSHVITVMRSIFLLGILIYLLLFYLFVDLFIQKYIYCYFVQPWASLLIYIVTNPAGLLIPWRALVFWWAYLKLRDLLLHFNLLWKCSAGSSAHVKEYSCIFLGIFFCLAMLMEKRQQKLFEGEIVNE